MGNCAQSEIEVKNSMLPGEYKKLFPIGKGAYGKVWKVIKEGSEQAYAMKEMDKSLVYSKKSVASVMNERKFLGMLRSPFIVNLHYAFQSATKLFLVVDLMSGGDLRYFFMKNPVIPEESLKFMAACIVAALEYLDVYGVIHRDLKPENLVFDMNGYLHLTDFGIASSTDVDNSGICSGTPGYMSPETICSQNQSTVSDYFALGVILFEVTTGSRPYLGNNRKEIRQAILNKQVKMPEKGSWSKEFKHFVNSLIQRKAQKRLGFGGIQELKSHPWLKDFDWPSLYTKSLKSPFKISPGNNFDESQVSGSFSSQGRLSESLSQKLFSGYFFSLPVLQ